LNWCLQASNDVESLYEDFCIIENGQVIDLIPGGRDIALTNSNKELYVEKKAQYHLYKCVEK
jgi:hypothetical protein